MRFSSKDTLSLSQFLLRSRTLKLYRDLLRTAKKVSDEEYRNDLRRWIREDFERNKNLPNEDVIKFHLSRGEAFHSKLLKTLNLSKSL